MSYVCVHILHRWTIRSDFRFYSLLFFKKWAIPGLFLVYFRPFQAKKQSNSDHKSMLKIVYPVLDSNRWLLEHKLSPITTRPVLPPNLLSLGRVIVSFWSITSKRQTALKHMHRFRGKGGIRRHTVICWDRD